jgi:hypothetical protein
MRKFLRRVILLLLAPVLYAFVAEAFSFLFASNVLFLVNWLTYGFIFYLLVYVFFLRSKIGFLEVFEHELSHTLVATLFLRKVKFFLATSENGAVGFQRPSNTIVTLSPYFLPVFTIPLLILKPFLTVGVYPALDFFLGLTLAFHFAALFKEFSPKQPDIIKAGLGYALVVVILLNSIFTILTLSFALENYAYIIDYCKNAMLEALHSYQAIGHALSNLFIFLRQASTSP